jgi:hypothetical protein
MIRIAVMLMTLALSIASAKSYTVETFHPMLLSGTELKPGQYKLDLNGGSIVLRKGKVAVEVKVKVETTGTKSKSTNFVCDEAGGKYQVKEIHLGGTDTKLVLN